MIKEFFAKLASWNSNQNKEWKRDASQRFMAESQRETNLANERKEMQQDHIKQNSAEEIDLNNELNAISQKEKHDKAA